MGSVKKNKRLITNRKFADEQSVEWIEIAENGEFYPCRNDIFIKTYQEV